MFRIRYVGGGKTRQSGNLSEEGLKHPIRVNLRSKAPSGCPGAMRDAWGEREDGSDTHNLSVKLVVTEDILHEDIPKHFFLISTS